MISTLELSDSHPLIIRLLLRKGIVDAKNLEQVRQAQLKADRPVEETLITLGLATDRDIARAYAEHLHLPWFDPASLNAHADSDLARLLPEKLCRDQLIAPVAIRDDTLDIVFATPNEMLVVDEIQLLTGYKVRPLIGSLSVVERLIAQLYYAGWAAHDVPSSTQEIEHVVDSADESDGDPVEVDDEILHLDQPPPPGRDGRIIRLANQILEQAFRAGASDIHLEPLEDGCAIRLRIDGVLNEITAPPRALFIPIVSRFKVLAKMDIAEKRIPQDGSIAIRTGERRVDLRVSSVPTVHSEKIVIRILDKSAIPLQLAQLGLDNRQAKDLIESIQMPHGLVLVTGPTGSGKSTTLYACLNLLNKPDKNICTVEDPVEYKLKGVNQIQVKSQVGLTFANALRSFLRQDPDILMVGEVRDQETAEICLRAALTGHFVLSTLHTNDALASVHRLQDMGIEPFLLASTLRVLEAQRLIRRICEKCRDPYDCDAETAKLHGLDLGQTLYRPTGCEHCRGTGYRGRVGIFEVVRINSRMAGLIQARTPEPQLRAAAREQGMKLLADSALDKVRQGMTSLEEALAVMIAADE
jgi:type IV pilus assembly protein PilB